MEQESTMKKEQASTPPGQKTGASSSELPPGWTRPTLDTLPRPTYWPLILAVGVIFALGGIVTSYGLSLVGLAAIVIAIVGWVGELRHDRRS
jgi:membrane-bound ClpP family serine protease